VASLGEQNRWSLRYDDRLALSLGSDESAHRTALPATSRRAATLTLRRDAATLRTTRAVANIYASTRLVCDARPRASVVVGARLGRLTAVADLNSAALRLKTTLDLKLSRALSVFATRDDAALAAGATLRYGPLCCDLQLDHLRWAKPRFSLRLRDAALPPPSS